MDKGKLVMILAFVTLGVLVFSVPATCFWGPQIGAIVRWTGVLIGIIYFVIRTKWKKENQN